MRNERYKRFLPATLAVLVLPLASSCNLSSKNCDRTGLAPGETKTNRRFTVTNGLPEGQVEIKDELTLSGYRVERSPVGHKVSLPDKPLSVEFHPNSHIQVESCQTSK